MSLRRILLSCLAILAIPCSLLLWWFYPGWVFHIYAGNPAAAEVKARQALPYHVLYEDMGSLIRIAVPADLSEDQLRATLVKVANERQDDVGRDYLISDYLSVEAYLTQGSRRSKEAAGTLNRFVPWTYPEERKRLKVDRSMFDKFTVSLHEAKQSLN